MSQLMQIYIKDQQTLIEAPPRPSGLRKFTQIAKIK